MTTQEIHETVCKKCSSHFYEKVPWANGYQAYFYCGKNGFMIGAVTYFLKNEYTSNFTTPDDCTYKLELMLLEQNENQLENL